MSEIPDRGRAGPTSFDEPGEDQEPEPVISPQPPSAPAADQPSRPVDDVRHSLAGGAWVGLVIAAVILIPLLIFILQNPDEVDVDFLGLRANLPLGVALLLAATAGALLVAVPGTARILQLRRRVRRGGGPST